ncbi:conserved protein of unknown function [Pseudomonas marincola]|uniref:Uncharacterized protein n=1 Tax=Pseudomonas marincola TaxID=437900 RepID=A0A653E8L2_9PSED|nr:conserved protein of unknown function [Pseudomonas marincola]
MLPAWYLLYRTAIPFLCSLLAKLLVDGRVLAGKTAHAVLSFLQRFDRLLLTGFADF